MLYLVLVLAALAAYSQPTARGVPWEEHPALSWNDFKGRPRRSGGEPSAVTDTGFRVQLECRGGALDIRVEAEFYGRTSWVKAGRQSPELLRHEQGHFDITELYARRMRKAIREAHLGCEDDRRAEAAGKKIFEELDRQWEKAQKEYDSETSDGTDLGKQIEALDRTARELAELRAYAQ